MRIDLIQNAIEVLRTKKTLNLKDYFENILINSPATQDLGDK